jgi:hypothetical protein
MEGATMTFNELKVSAVARLFNKSLNFLGDPVGKSDAIS